MEFVRANGKSLRTPIGKFCLSITRVPGPANADGALQSAFGAFCSSVYGIFESAKEPQAFGAIKNPLEDGMCKLYALISSIIPKGKSASQQAEETLMKSGWTEEKILEVRQLELQYRPQF